MLLLIEEFMLILLDCVLKNVLDFFKVLVKLFDFVFFFFMNVKFCVYFGIVLGVLEW